MRPVRVRMRPVPVAFIAAFVVALLAGSSRAAANSPAAPTPAAPTPAAPATPASTPNAEISPPMPRLTLSAGVIFGPHAKGEADCQEIEDGYSCRHHGDFLGAGASIELRAQLYKPLYLHVRGLLVGNVRKRPYAAHSGLTGGGIGIGAYSRLAFVRGEYLLVPTLGSDSYIPPFYDKPEARDEFGLHAGMLSAGIHKYVSPRVALEAWAGLVVGPSSRRTTVNAQANERRTLVSFMVNVGLSFDVLLAKGYTPPPKQPRQRRQW